IPEDKRLIQAVQYAVTGRFPLTIPVPFNTVRLPWGLSHQAATTGGCFAGMPCSSDPVHPEIKTDHMDGARPVCLYPYPVFGPSCLCKQEEVLPEEKIHHEERLSYLRELSR